MRNILFDDGEDETSTQKGYTASTKPKQVPGCNILSFMEEFLKVEYGNDSKHSKQFIFNISENRLLLGAESALPKEFSDTGDKLLSNEQAYLEIEEFLGKLQHVSEMGRSSGTKNEYLLQITSEVEDCLKSKYKYNPSPLFYPSRNDTNLKKYNRIQLIDSLGKMTKDTYCNGEYGPVRNLENPSLASAQVCPGSTNLNRLHVDHFETFTVHFRGVKNNMLELDRRERKVFLSQLPLKDLGTFQQALLQRMCQLKLGNEFSSVQYQLYTKIFDDVGEERDARNEASSGLEVFKQPLRAICSRISWIGSTLAYN
ncbi:uncharacterized protein CANTADRAFT_6280 [Suhomyces tanzawaensis NRRL Y-17324]|uniref:Uncharacterized protein n=1 Tax=Suhomyces tanzawaensis NRRL Y-17324 TaxID=984487 RepID=A0A1E4SHX9_9ASCO|nr:uncharacterized protein CANTADRAFT_6280 [Suhomyces tanzawaensis NRRL Y-17324]ODV79105.1 hypothetical protein CANTADRAFT_6280 [Suhomyces tanzawaensis NRRL Y-17324]